METSPGGSNFLLMINTIEGVFFGMHIDGSYVFFNEVSVQIFCPFKQLAGLSYDCVEMCEIIENIY